MRKLMIAIYWFVVLIASLLTLIFVTNFQAYVHAMRIGILPYHWYIGASVVFFMLALVSGKILRLPKVNVYIISWFVALLVLMGCSLIIVSNSPASLQVFKDVALFCTIAITFALLVTEPKIAKACGVAVALAVCILAAVSYFEFFNPDFNAINDIRYQSQGIEGRVERVGGLHENPNANAYALALGMFVGQYFLPLKFRFIFAMVVGGAVLATVSRSGISLWAIIFLISFWTGVYSRGRALSRVFGLLIITILSSLLVTGQVPEIIESLGLESNFSSTMLERLSGNLFDQGDSSTDSRKSLMADSLARFVDNPIFGSGLGTSSNSISDLGTHNLALQMAVETGIFGLLLYFGLLLIPIAAKSQHGTLFVIFFFIANMFTHTSYQKPIFSILLPLSILAFVSPKVKHVSSKAKHKRRHRRRRSHPNDRPVNSSAASLIKS